MKGVTLTERYRVLLVDDEEEIREGVKRAIDWESLGFELAGDSANGMDALELAEQLRPDVVLTDIKMPYMDGLELCRRLKQVLPAAKLVVFSGFDDFKYARSAIAMNVSEYILKPINSEELCGVLKRLHGQLDSQRLERLDMELLRKRYEESLPMLREMFYTRLLDGKIKAGEVLERAARCEIELPEGVWTAALVSTVCSEQGRGRDELVLLSIRSFFTDSFSLEGCSLRAVMYNEQVALLIHLEDEGKIYALIDELERLCLLAESILGLNLSAGVGRPCRGAQQLARSVKEAAAAVDYRVLLGKERVLYIGDLEPYMSGEYISFEDDDLRELSGLVKLGAREDVVDMVRRQVARARAAHLSPVQSRIFFLEMFTGLTRLARTNGVDVEAVFGETFSGMISTSDFRSFDELEARFIGWALKLWEELSRRRTDSAWKTVEQAKSFIAENYGDCELSVEKVCEHLHISPTYFSTLFKRETGESFTSYVTDIRMACAERLLTETDEKTYLIAERSGYADPNYFSYVFKKRFGVTPSKFRAGRDERG